MEITKTHENFMFDMFPEFDFVSLLRKEEGAR
jgi:hypothetical protein